MNPLANMFVNIVNASRAHHESVMIPYSQFKMEIARFLHQKGYIGEVARRGRKNKRFIELTLKYTNTISAIHGMKQISKQSQRIYAGVQDLKAMASRRGVIIVSTPKGLLSGKDAVKQKVGGEIVGQVW